MRAGPAPGGARPGRPRRGGLRGAEGRDVAGVDKIDGVAHVGWPTCRPVAGRQVGLSRRASRDARPGSSRVAWESLLEAEAEAYAGGGCRAGQAGPVGGAAVARRVKFLVGKGFVYLLQKKIGSGRR